jgi:hypothetical protein
MLKKSDGRKPKFVEVDNGLWYNLTHQSFEDLKKKLTELRSMIDLKVDEYICAGVYTFVLEEFGKVLLLLESPLVGKNKDKRGIKYSSVFGNHDNKFSTALDYLQIKKFEEAYVLNNEGSFSPKSFGWRRFTIGQMVTVEARLNLFFSDLNEDTTGKITISQRPYIDPDYLKAAVIAFEKAMNAFKLKLS